MLKTYQLRLVLINKLLIVILSRLVILVNKSLFRLVLLFRLVNGIVSCLDCTSDIVDVHSRNSPQGGPYVPFHIDEIIRETLE